MIAVIWCDRGRCKSHLFLERRIVPSGGGAAVAFSLFPLFQQIENSPEKKMGSRVFDLLEQQEQSGAGPCC
jgi:hypothetical protein